MYGTYVESQETYSDEPDAVCVEQTGIDEQCVDFAIARTINSRRGPWTPWNTCEDYVQEILSGCYYYYKPFNSYDPTGGSEGAPGW